MGVQAGIECGVPYNNNTGLIYNGRELERYEFPW